MHLEGETDARALWKKVCKTSLLQGAQDLEQPLLLLPEGYSVLPNVTQVNHLKCCHIVCPHLPLACACNIEGAKALLLAFRTGAWFAVWSRCLSMEIRVCNEKGPAVGPTCVLRHVFEQFVDMCAAELVCAAPCHLHHTWKRMFERLVFCPILREIRNINLDV